MYFGAPDAGVHSRSVQLDRRRRSVTVRRRDARRVHLHCNVGRGDFLRGRWSVGKVDGRRVHSQLDVWSPDIRRRSLRPGRAHLRLRQTYVQRRRSDGSAVMDDEVQGHNYRLASTR